MLGQVLMSEAFGSSLVRLFWRFHGRLGDEACNRQGESRLAVCQGDPGPPQLAVQRRAVPTPTRVHAALDAQSQHD